MRLRVNGIEPSMHGLKGHCHTTWLHSQNVYTSFDLEEDWKLLFSRLASQGRLIRCTILYRIHFLRLVKRAFTMTDVQAPV